MCASVSFDWPKFTLAWHLYSSSVVEEVRWDCPAQHNKAKPCPTKRKHFQFTPHSTEERAFSFGWKLFPHTLTHTLIVCRRLLLAQKLQATIMPASKRNSMSSFCLFDACALDFETNDECFLEDHNPQDQCDSGDVAESSGAYLSVYDDLIPTVGEQDHDALDEEGRKDKGDDELLGKNVTPDQSPLTLPLPRNILFSCDDEEEEKHDDDDTNCCSDEEDDYYYGSPVTDSSVELQLEFQRTLKKLAKSMRRTEESRSIVKRQRVSRCRGSSTGSSGSGGSGSSSYVSIFEDKTMEYARRKVKEVIRIESKNTVGW
jgi:hypothetical protein